MREQPHGTSNDLHEQGAKAVLIWLASYPRSGNSLLRSILKQAFGRNTFSLYNDPNDLGSSKERSRLIGHISYPMPWDRFYNLATKKDKLYFVKTHGEPLDEAPTIYLVRDGRASVVSYYHYIDTFEQTSVDLTDVVIGRLRFGSWSEHFDLWRPNKRKSTLLLKYEDLIAEPQAAVERIAEFANLQIVGTFQNKFAEHKKAFPEFFRSGSNRDDIEELCGEAKQLFDLIHSGLMAKLGYSRKSPRIHRVARRILLAQRDTIVELEARKGLALSAKSEQLRAVEKDRQDAMQAQQQTEEKLKLSQGMLSEAGRHLSEAVADRNRLAADLTEARSSLSKAAAELHEANSTVAKQAQRNRELELASHALEDSLRALLRSRWRRLGVALRLSKRHPTPFGEM